MIKGDKIKLIKPMGEFTNVGEVCEVVKVDEDGVISFRFGRNGVHLGCMSYNEFEKYFELIDKENSKKKSKKTWCKWRNFVFNCYDPNLKPLSLEGFYRTNGKKVQVKYILGNDKTLRAEATCCNKDKFDLVKGLKLAQYRFRLKFLKLKTDELVKTM